MVGFFHLLRLTLRNADRDALPTLVKPIFAFFLDVFDLRHRLQQQGVDASVSKILRWSLREPMPSFRSFGPSRNRLLALSLSL